MKYPTPERVAGCEETNQRWLWQRQDQLEGERFAKECLKTMSPSEFLIRQWNKHRTIEEVNAALAKYDAHLVDMKLLGYDREDTGDYRTGFC